MILRIIRELLLRKNIIDGSISIHGAALKINNTGFLLLGNKGAGKTTLACHLLNKRAFFLTNDRIICTKDLEYLYLPMSSMISKFTILSNDKLLMFLNNSNFARNQALDHKNIVAKYSFISKEIQDIFECGLISTMNAQIIIFPSISSTESKVSINKLSRKNSQILLYENILTSNDEMWPNSYLLDDTNTNIELNEKNIVTKILDHTICIQLFYGYDSSANQILYEISKFIQENLE